MRIRTSRLNAPVVQPRRTMVLAVKRCFSALSGRSQRLAQRSRERFEQLDPDQQVREVGEW